MGEIVILHMFLLIDIVFFINKFNVHDREQLWLQDAQGPLLLELALAQQWEAYVILCLKLKM